MSLHEVVGDIWNVLCQNSLTRANVPEPDQKGGREEEGRGVLGVHVKTLIMTFATIVLFPLQTHPLTVTSLSQDPSLKSHLSTGSVC